MLAPAAAGDGYAEKSVFGANLKGPAPPAKPDCWPRTAPVPMTSFSSPQQEAHMEVAPACKHPEKKKVNILKPTSHMSCY